MKDERYLAGFTFLSEGALTKKSLFITVSICFVLVLGSASQIHAQSAAGITGLAGFETGFQVIASVALAHEVVFGDLNLAARLSVGETTRMITRDYLSVLVPNCCGLSLASVPAMTTVSRMMKGNPSAPVAALAILACMTARQTYSFRKGEVEIGNSD